MVEKKIKATKTKKTPAKTAAKVQSAGGAIAYAMVGADGQEAGTLDLDPTVFGTKIYKDLVHQAIRWQRARTHQGTHATINKAKFKGGSRKPFAQKGTGNARAGGADSPIWVGGAVAHGPQPKNTYEFRFSRRARRQALTSILTDRVKRNKLVVLKSLDLKEGRTKELKAVLEKLGLGTKKVTLLVSTTKNELTDALVWRAAGNLRNVNTISVAGVNAFDLMNGAVVLGTSATIKALEQRLQAEAAA